MIGNHVAEIFVEDQPGQTVFHWTVRRSDKPGVIALGEQSSYEVARQEAEHHLKRLADAEKCETVPPLRQVASA